MALLYAMKHLQKFYPKSFDLCAVTVDLGFGNFDLQAAKIFCQKLSVPYTVVPTEISQIVFESRQESNPCALCAKMRKGALNKAAKDLGCNKIAYAHHRDDVIDTMMLSLIYEGRFHTFSPKTYLDRMDLFVIRPFYMYRRLILLASKIVTSFLYVKIHVRLTEKQNESLLKI
mgnify:CR=1 FL=1